MPMIDADGCLLNVSVEGRDGGPTLMLSNSLGTTMAMWEPQMKALTQLFRVIRYDRRGHGKSGVQGPYSLERFGKDVLAILDDLNIEKTHWCGLSMGGMVGQWLGANAPERFGKLVLANTTCYFPDPTNWLNRIKTVKEGGMEAVTRVKVLGSSAGLSFLQLRLLTGRTHQIRVHLAHAGFPVLGDDKYGDFELNRALARQGVKRLFLHARRLAFKHPVDGRRITLDAPLPEDMQRFCSANFGALDA